MALYPAYNRTTVQPHLGGGLKAKLAANLAPTMGTKGAQYFLRGVNEMEMCNCPLVDVVGEMMVFSNTQSRDAETLCGTFNKQIGDDCYYQARVQHAILDEVAFVPVNFYRAHDAILDEVAVDFFEFLPQDLRRERARSQRPGLWDENRWQEAEPFKNLYGEEKQQLLDGVQMLEEEHACRVVGFKGNRLVFETQTDPDKLCDALQDAVAAWDVGVFDSYGDKVELVVSRRPLMVD